jgi:argininosuccinate lyase
MKLRKSFAIVFCALLSLAANAAERDEFFWLGEMNKATAVINSEEGLLDKAVTPKIARGIEEVITNGSKPGAKRPKKVIAFAPYQSCGNGCHHASYRKIEPRYARYLSRSHFKR